MKPILAFLKTHGISLACGIVAIVALAFTFLFMGDDTVQKKMADTISQTGASSIQSMAATAKNDALINREKALAGSLEKQYQDALAAVRQINRREPLMPGVFPKAASASTVLEFKQTYAEKIAELPKVMQAGSTPTPEEVEEEKDNVEALRKAEAEKQAELQVADRQPQAPGVPTPNTPITAPPQSTRLGRGFVQPGEGGGRFARGGGGGEEGEGFGGRGRGGGPIGGDFSINSTEEPKYNPALRAAVNKAKSIQLYYEPDRTMHSSEIIDDPGAPSPLAMWEAQVGYWIQADVVNAISALHAEAAKKVQGGDASVGELPVKRLVSIRVHGYSLQGKFIHFGMSSRLSQGGTSGPDPAAQATFTQRTGNDQYDVVRFTVQAIVDQRELFKLVDAIAKANFTVPVGISYESVNRDDEEKMGYLYGPAPIVLATLNFETYLARDLYTEMMPEDVRTLLGVAATQKP